jgi:PIN domain nuclease of toxin-antitoxin system
LIVLDTHAWLWWWAEGDDLSQAARHAIESADAIGITAISCWEVGMLAKKRRIHLDVPAPVWVEETLAVARILPLDLTPEIAVAAADLEWDNGDPADRIIVATAIIHDAALVTRDRRMHAFAGVRTIW